MVPHDQTLALLALLLFTTFICRSAHADRLALSPGWNFSVDLSFPPSSSSHLLNSYVSDNIAPFSLFVPILNSTSFSAGSKGFSLGFLSWFDSSSASSASQIFFCICLGVSRNGPMGTGRPFLVPVWTLNDMRPLQQQGQLGFVKLAVNESEQLVLEDGDGTTVWSMGNMGSMEMNDTGNLVLYDGKNQTIWQSFNNASGDTLLQEQQFRLGMELRSNNRMYKAIMRRGGFLFYFLPSSPLPLAYWIFASNTTVDSYFNRMLASFALNASAPINLTASVNSPSCGPADSNDPYAVLNGDTLELRGDCQAENSWQYGTSDMVRLDADGNMRDYRLQQLPNISYALVSHREDYRPCYVPNVCGAYGICTVNSFQHDCRCPSEKDNATLYQAFRPIDASRPSEGCERTEALMECKPNSAQAQQLVEIKNVTSIAMLFLFELTWRENSIPLKDCKAACSSNCSCTGFLYHMKSSFCLPFADKTGIYNLSFMTLSSNDHVAYVKIQPKVQHPKSGPALDAGRLHPIVIVVVVLLPIIFTACIGGVMYKMCKQTRDLEVQLAEQQLLGVMPTLPTRFSYQELSRFTKGFSTRLGSGGFGSVYAGVLPDGKSIAVKKLELLSHGQKEFLAEIATIGGIRHVNIVHLYGFCLEKQHRLLVYEYVENGSLDKWLFVKEWEQQLPVLSWETRYNVALGTARGLAFLHEECPEPILHFDVKPQNILLDEDFNAKIADFGLAKLVAKGESSVMTVVRGTPGYIAPEWVSHSAVSKKCDVYSFGMVLLELVSGTRNSEFQLLNEWPFPKWAARKSREGKAVELLDQRLLATPKNDEEHGMFAMVEKTIVEQVTRVVGVALMCISKKPERRPTMTGVCNMLEGNAVLPKDLYGLEVEASSLSDSLTASSSSSQVSSHHSSSKACS